MANEQLKLAAGSEATGLSPSIHPRVFQHTVDQADIAISITDVRGNILYVNPAFSRVTGYNVDEAAGQERVDTFQQDHAAARSTRRCGSTSRTASRGADA
jgi:PAS domain S-box-containing protein